MAGIAIRKTHRGRAMSRVCPNGVFDWVSTLSMSLRDGEITRVTRDHSVVQNLVDAGMLRPEEAETHESSNLITRAVGVAEKIEVEMVSGDARPGDLFLLASDGLTRVVRDDELAAELGQGEPA